MCLGIPGRVVRVARRLRRPCSPWSTCEGAQRPINLGMLEDMPSAPGDWVLIHMGFAVERIDEAGAERGDVRAGADGPQRARTAGGARG